MTEVISQKKYIQTRFSDRTRPIMAARKKNNIEKKNRCGLILGVVLVIGLHVTHRVDTDESATRATIMIISMDRQSSRRWVGDSTGQVSSDQAQQSRLPHREQHHRILFVLDAQHHNQDHQGKFPGQHQVIQDGDLPRTGPQCHPRPAARHQVKRRPAPSRHQPPDIQPCRGHGCPGYRGSPAPSTRATRLNWNDCHKSDLLEGQTLTIPPDCVDKLFHFYSNYSTLIFVYKIIFI